MTLYYGQTSRLFLPHTSNEIWNLVQVDIYQGIYINYKVKLIFYPNMKKTTPLEL